MQKAAEELAQLNKIEEPEELVEEVPVEDKPVEEISKPQEPAKIKKNTQKITSICDG